MVSQRLGDRLFSFLIWLIPLGITSLFLWIIGDIFWHGLGQINWQFLTAAPIDSGRDGGIAPIILSTAYILIICMGVSLPLGVGTALLLAEFCDASSRFGRLVRRSLDILAGVPSIVFGLFGNALFVKVFGFGFSILAGGLTLACMVLPLLIRSTEEGLRAVPRTYRLSSASLGISHTKTLWHLVLPAAIPGLVVGFTLGLGRVIAETAALIFTSGYVDRMPTSLLDSGRSLSIHIYDLAMNISNGNANAYGTASILILLLLLINGSTSLLGNYWMRRHLKF
ncbi:phosphate ABC transporter membrane protein 2, PhoT family [[Leptolyngbya] sp. PCC 7376]|uniref:phosphate ABC transporter permease PstA n=1 Tax=[Leptolyngbya] sp. PCC 7376 TaxID=111781 RepID=UPI00029ED4EF|nr:phosphate ABC transporter permease PstA [[Leptolyngbya] sp. PCC 7376]AFY37388.1 phosphate ABC transporter membrane protein 2, PhoT family [[Leptolyngbya] sp. PCC 7376]